MSESHFDVQKIWMMKISQEGVPWKTIFYCCHALYVDILLQVVRVPWEAGYGERDAPDTSDPSMYMSSNQKTTVRQDNNS